MPRHPPCALHSLSHKHSTKNTNYKDRHPHTPNQQHAECQICDKPWCRPAARCSRPLFTDQEPHPPTPTDNHTVTDRRRRPRQHAPTPTPPRAPITGTPRARGSAPDLSGPNSVPTPTHANHTTQVPHPAPAARKSHPGRAVLRTAGSATGGVLRRRFH
jgi:hypothetical protein